MDEQGFLHNTTDFEHIKQLEDEIFDLEADLDQESSRRIRAEYRVEELRAELADRVSRAAELEEECYRLERREAALVDQLDRLRAAYRAEKTELVMQYESEVKSKDEELTFLRAIWSRCDFGPADEDVRVGLYDWYRRVYGKIPAGWGGEE